MQKLDIFKQVIEAKMRDRIALAESLDRSHEIELLKQVCLDDFADH